jgi:hypothetical protein
MRFLLFYSFPGTNRVPAPAVIHTPSFPQIPVALSNPKKKNYNKRIKNLIEILFLNLILI